MASDQRSQFFFPPWSNYLLPVLVIGVLGGAVYIPVLVGFGGSANTLNSGYQPTQPVDYSHALHAGVLGIDCRYCHTTVEQATFAAIPPTQVCISCHNPSQTTNGVRKNSPKLAKVHESYATGKPIEWVKVHDLPDFVYFNHSAHVLSGVGCATCHGPVDKMDDAGVYQFRSLSMSWCLDCHRNPQENLRPPDQITNMAWLPPLQQGESLKQAQIRLGEDLSQKTYTIHDREYMQSCSVCHR